MASFHSWIFLINHVKTALTFYELIVSVPGFEIFEWTSYFHDCCSTWGALASSILLSLTFSLRILFFLERFLFSLASLILFGFFISTAIFYIKSQKKQHIISLVGTVGIEPTTPTMSTWCSTTELRALCKWDYIYHYLLAIYTYRANLFKPSGVNILSLWGSFNLHCTLGISVDLTLCNW